MSIEPSPSESNYCPLCDKDGVPDPSCPYCGNLGSVIWRNPRYDPPPWPTWEMLPDTPANCKEAEAVVDELHQLWEEMKRRKSDFSN